jgi:hypothetical protein
MIENTQDLRQLLIRYLDWHPECGESLQELAAEYVKMVSRMGARTNSDDLLLVAVRLLCEADARIARLACIPLDPESKSPYRHSRHDP